MLDILGKYFQGKKCHFYMHPKAKDDRHEIVVIIHGLIRRSVALRPMGGFFARHGFTVYIYDYKTSAKGMSAHGKDLRVYLCKIIAENPGVPVNIVTHSMGGILARYALAKRDESPRFDFARIKRIVMLAPPHGGSSTARRFVKYLPFTGKLVKPLPELSDSPDSIIHSAPLIDEGPEVGIVAAKYDRQVKIKDTHFPGMKEHFIIKAEHSFMVYLPSVHKAALRFLTTGSFD